MILHIIHAIVSAENENTATSKMITGVSLSSYAKTMRQSDKYQNFLIFIALSHRYEVQR